MKRKGKEVSTVCVTKQVTAMGNQSLILLENSGKWCRTCISELCHPRGKGVEIVYYTPTSLNHRLKAT